MRDLEMAYLLHCREFETEEGRDYTKEYIPQEFEVEDNYGNVKRIEIDYQETLEPLCYCLNKEYGITMEQAKLLLTTFNDFYCEVLETYKQIFAEEE